MMRDRINSFKYAINGFRLVVKSEVNMKIHMLAALLVLAASIILKLNPLEWVLIILCIFLVWAAEIGNTVVEKYMDTYHPERNVHVGAIKDMSAAAVLVLSIGAVITGCIIFIPKVMLFL